MSYETSVEDLRLAALSPSLTDGDEGYVRCPPGTFLMGSDKSDSESYEHLEYPAHQVTLSRGFWLKKTPVTKAEWKAVVGSLPSACQGSPDTPIEQVSWYEAVWFCNELSKKKAVPPAYRFGEIQGEVGTSSFQIKDVESIEGSPGYRLPTEAEWEYAARAGTNGPRYGDLERIAWYRETSQNRIHEVAQKDPNPWGLYDMLGNVYEWCFDAWASYKKEDAGLPPNKKETRMIRGGAWNENQTGVRASFRFEYEPTYRIGWIGFRLLRYADESPRLSNPADAVPSNDMALPPSKAGSSTDATPPSPKATTADSTSTRYDLQTPPKPTMLLIRPCTFQMGSDLDKSADSQMGFPSRQITLTRAFWMQETPVTQGQFQAVMGYNPSTHKQNGLEAPVESVSWFEAAWFCNLLSKKEGLPEAYRLEQVKGDPAKRSLSFGKIEILPHSPGFRLPTALEWECAAWAGQAQTSFRVEDLDRIAWYEKNGQGTTHPVKQKEPNPWGLYDLQGNVWEWCFDAQQKKRTDNAPATDLLEEERALARNSQVKLSRILKGGCWLTIPSALHPSFFIHFGASDKLAYNGFRVVRWAL